MPNYTYRWIHSHPEKMPILYHQSCMILQGPHIPPMAFTSCHYPGSSPQPSDERAGTLTTQPIQLAYYFCSRTWLDLLVHTLYYYRTGVRISTKLGTTNTSEQRERLYPPILPDQQALKKDPCSFWGPPESDLQSE